MFTVNTTELQTAWSTVFLTRMKAAMLLAIGEANMYNIATVAFNRCLTV